MNDTLEGIWKEEAVAQSKYYSGILLEENYERTQGILCFNRNSRREPPEYESRSLPLNQTLRCVA
jgi:hypothetical protein